MIIWWPKWQHLAADSPLMTEMAWLAVMWPGSKEIQSVGGIINFPVSHWATDCGTYMTRMDNSVAVFGVGEKWTIFQSQFFWLNATLSVWKHHVTDVCIKVIHTSLNRESSLIIDPDGHLSCSDCEAQLLRSVKGDSHTLEPDQSPARHWNGRVHPRQVHLDHLSHSNRTRYVTLN